MLNDDSLHKFSQATSEAEDDQDTLPECEARNLDDASEEGADEVERAVDHLDLDESSKRPHVSRWVGFSSLGMNSLLRSKKKKREKQASAPITPPSEIPVPMETPSPQVKDGNDTLESEDDGKPEEISKRDKRRAKEAKKKVEMEAHSSAANDSRKSEKRNLTSGDSFIQQDGKLDKGDDLVTVKSKTQAPKKAAKGKVLPLVDEFSGDKVAKSVESVREKGDKIAEKWGNHLYGESL